MATSTSVSNNKISPKQRLLRIQYLNMENFEQFDVDRFSSNMGDQKIKFILKTSNEFFNIASNDLEKGIINTNIREFLDYEEITILVAQLSETNCITYQYEIPNSEDTSLIFYKIPKICFDETDDANSLLQIGFLTLNGGVIRTIYNTMERIFSTRTAMKQYHTAELKTLMANLQKNLNSTLGLPESNILSIRDEINFWSQKQQQLPTKADKEAARTFTIHLEKLLEFFGDDERLAATKVEEFLDSIHNILDEIWRMPYKFPQNRMTGVLDVLSYNILDCCMNIVQKENYSDFSSLSVNDSTNQILEITESWIQLCDSLTRLFWSNYGQHLWIGETYTPQLNVKFKKRVEEALEIKNIYKQIQMLFGKDDKLKLNSEEFFSSFKSTNIYDITSMGEKHWATAKETYEIALGTIDERIGSRLKQLIHSNLDNSRQIIYLFSKYHGVLKRPTILKILNAEREHLFQSLKVLINELKEGMKISKFEENEVSGVVAEIKWLKIIESQLKITETVCQQYLSDRKEFADTYKNLQMFIEEIGSQLKVNYETWCENTLEAIRRSELILRDTDRVVKFEKGERQLMTVTFNPKLVTFCNDVNNFQNLGYRLPTDIIKCASTAMNFISFARHLQQIAIFHNTIGDRMLPCHRPIMLESAVEFSRLVKSESVSWNNEESIKRYLTVLQAAINKLSKQNIYLMGCHENAKKSILKLMNADLISNSSVWKEEMKSLREMFADLERQGYNNLNPFRLHLDYQLYKALEYQYIVGLSDTNINQKIADINVDIIFRQQRIQFRPCFEKIKFKYYSRLRKFLEEPLNFKGLSDQSGGLYKKMVERNRHRFIDMYKKAETIFKKLLDLQDTWLPWIALGCVEIEQLCQVHLTSSSDWDYNFKACKNFSQKIAKIQNNEMIIDCFVINLSPLRSDIESISRRFWEALSLSLKSSTLNEISELQLYLSTSLKILEHIPEDENGIIEASVQYEKITTDLPKMKAVLKSVENKDICLAGWCKERVTLLHGITQQWTQLQPLIDNHQSLLQRQLEIIKNSILQQITTLIDDAEKFAIRWESTLKELEANERSDMTLFKERQSQWVSIQEKRENLLEMTEKFNVEFPNELNEKFLTIKSEIEKFGEQWRIFEEFSEEDKAIGNEEWSIYRRRPYILMDLLMKWEKSIASDSKVSIAKTRISNILSKYKMILPILNLLQSDCLIEKHWTKIFILLCRPVKPYQDIVLNDILSSVDDLLEQGDEIKLIIRQATSEQIILKVINELEQWALTSMLKVVIHTDSRGQQITLLKDFSDVLNKIGDNQCLLQSAKNSAAYESFSDQASIWETKLNTIDFILTNLNVVQRKWIYLEPIFSAGTLKSEEMVFKRIDKDFRYIQNEINQDLRVISLYKINNISSIIETLQKQLARCQATLSTYIMAKRNAFSRFYFLSDDDLLEILGQSSKEEIIQKHITKIFPGIAKLRMNTNDSSTTIIGICSAEEDTIALSNPIPVTAIVEDWLNKLVTEMKSVLNRLIMECYQNERLTIELIERYPMQIFTLTNSIHFTKLTEKAILSMRLNDHLKMIQSEINKYTVLLKETTDTLLRFKLRSLLMDLVQQSSTVEYLISHNVTNEQDWYWLQQMKFYIDKDKVYIKMVYAEFEYSYEFLGNYNKLVYTKLVHNCYLTLTQAMKLGLGGNPFGPAGTGKTECVKALGAILGRLVFVFNCSENVDTTAMGLILSGLSRCGAWGCFDEFNRLEETTLSAISMLIQPLQMALKENKTNVMLGTESVPLNGHCCIFVTLNPVGEEYGGRQKLPINLQLLFRPIVMEYPNDQEIAKVYLFVEGFKYAEQISVRVVELFNLAKKILSHQKHYDWGLRELKMVLTACGKLLNTDHKNIEDEINEMELVVRALRSNTMSRLTLSDCKKFDILIRDVFPKINLELSVNTELRTKILESFSLMGLKQCDRQVEKCLELSEQLQKRMGVALIGPSGSGKSTLIALLKEAYTSMSKTIRTYTISPKSMNRVQLLGILDTDTRQWHDGVLTKTAIAVNAELPNITSWIICDGDIDPDWIEALNSVLDDNRLLTLPSGWRIQFGSNVNFIFETHDLSNASPATISRMGIINLSAEDLNSNLIIDSWLALHDSDDTLSYYFDNYFNRAIEWIESNQYIPKNLSKICLIKCGLKMLGNEKNKEEFCVNLLRGLNSLLDCNIHNEFANMLFEWANIYVSNQNRAEYCYYNSFRSMIELYEMQESVSTSEENKLVKTPMAQVNSDILRNFLRKTNKNIFMIVGPSGCGKSLILESILNEFSNYQLVIISCSAQLTTKHILHTLKQNCLSISGVKGKEFKPKQTRLVLYFKNLDFCPTDKYGTSEVIEFLLQMTNSSGFYADNEEWISVSGIQICGSLSNIQETQISARFLSICSILQMRYPEQNDIKKIIENYLVPIKLHFENFNIANMDKFLNAIINIYNEIINQFKLDTSNHYNFSPTLIEKWITQLVNYPKNKFADALCFECRRIFSDRLISLEDVEKFEMALEENLKYLSIFSPKNSVVFTPRGHKTADLQFEDTETWNETINRSIIHCNAENSTIEMPPTEEIVLTVSALCRALSRPFTNIVLCGKNGSGRSESLYIACTIMQVKIFLPQTVASYSLNEFYNDLKLAMQTAALDNEPVVFYISHSLIGYSSDILKPCEAILEGSEIPDLFNDDLETIASSLKNQAQMEGYQSSLASYFLQRVKLNLHLVIALEETSNDLQKLFKIYPALYRKTELIWMKEFSKKSIEALPSDIIRNIVERVGAPFDKDDIPLPSYISNILSLAGEWKNSPRRYQQLIKTYYNLYQKQKQLKINHYNKLKIGVDRLSEAYELVEKLKIEAESKQEALAEKRQLATKALEMISSTMRNANDQKSDLIDLKKQTEESSGKLLQRKVVIEKELSLVEPLLREAIAAVGQIKTEALSEIRSLRAPPDTIRDILEGVLRLMGIRDTSWNSMKTFLAKRGIKEDIKLLDAARISPENCQAVEKLVEMRSDSFDIKNAKRASVAAAPLAAWVVANIKYSKVIQSIKPLEREQNELKRNLEKSESDMKSLSTGLDKVNIRVQELSDELNMYTQEAALLEIKLEDSKSVLKTAEILVDNLNNEYRNWNKELQDINLEIGELEKNTFLLSLCITHFSNMTTDTRIKYLTEISDQLNFKKFKLDNYLVTNQDRIIWESMGLTNDQQSIENSGILTKILEIPYGSTPIPLLLDPSGEACKWLSQYLLSLNKVFEITTQNAERFTNVLELAVRFGKILIVNDVNTIIPPLLSLLTAKSQPRFGKKLIQIGNKMIDFHENFQLIFITKMNAITLDGSIAANIMILPFTVTTSGLSYRLLSEWILFKEPELEDKRVKLLRNEGVLLKEKIKLQDDLLQELSSAQGDILKNETLLNTLNNIKESTVTIEKSLQESYQIRINLMEGFEKHRLICDQISNFYMGISRVHNLDVSKFIQLFLNVVKEGNDKDTESYYQMIIKKSYIILSRSIPKTKHNTLALNICREAYENLVPEREWESFISNFMSSADASGDNNIPDWIKSELSSKILVLKSQHPQLYDVLKLHDEFLWKDYVNPASHKNKIPVHITDFQKILISQILRPDLLIQTITSSVGCILGFKNMSIPSPSIRTLAMESSSDYPIMLVTTSGLDPSQEIRATAENVLGPNKYFEISIGKGQENTASDLLRTAIETGKWICVKNVHLVPNWLASIDDILNNSKIQKSDNFKFWLICDTDVGLSESFVFRCFKVLLEPPSNIKFKVRYLFDQNSALLSKQKDYKTIKLYVSFFLLHSVLQQRRIYIPQGWCKWYDFGDSDLKTAMDFVEWSNQYKLDWPVLQGLCKKIAYGGRINNTQDLEKLDLYVKKFLDANMMNSKWQPPSLNITFTNSNRLEDYQNTIEQLPDIDTPEIFGLSSSTNISRNILCCRELLKDLRQIYFHIDINQSFDKRIRPLMSLWKKIATGLSIEQTYIAMMKQNEASYDDKAWMLFLISEIKLARELCREIHGILTTLYNAIKEIHNISESLKQILVMLCENQTPREWRNIWFGPTLATDYIRAFVNRANYIEKLYHQYMITASETAINEINLAEIFNVHAFLAVLKLTKSRSLQISTSELVISTNFNNKEIDPSAIKVSNLMIDGGFFFKNQLIVRTTESTANSLNCTPPFYLCYKEVRLTKKLDSQNLNIPLYSNISRDNLICYLPIPIGNTVSEIICSGVSLIIPDTL